MLRQLLREENPDCHEIVRRFGTDEADFRDYKLEEVGIDLCIQNDKNYFINDVCKQIVEYLKGQNLIK